MAFSRPTLSTLIDRIRVDLATRIFGTSAATPRLSVLGKIAEAIAGAIHGLYGYLDWLSRQAFIDTAEGDYLARLAAVYGIARNAGTRASGNITVTGDDSASMPAGTIWRRADGAQYETTTTVTPAPGGTSVAVEAVDVGEDSNAEEAEELTIESPIAGIVSAAPVEAGGLTGGADLEADDSLRRRVSLRLQSPPQGGTAADYEQWALAANPLVTRAFVAPAAPEPGSVTIYVLTDDGVGGIEAAAGTISDAQDYIDARKPVTATAYVVTPTPVAVDITLSISPDTAAVRAAIEAELLAEFTRRSEPELGAGEGTFRLSWLREAVGRAVGEDFHNLTVPAADVSFSVGEQAVLGTVSYI